MCTPVTAHQAIFQTKLQLLWGFGKNEAAIISQQLVRIKSVHSTLGQGAEKLLRRKWHTTGSPVPFGDSAHNKCLFVSDVWSMSCMTNPSPKSALL